MSWLETLLLAALALGKSGAPASAAQAAGAPDAGAAEDADWARIAPGLALAFPRDHGAHPAYRTEWWYLTGNVADASGRPFGFQLTIFRIGRDPRPLAAGESPLRARQLLAGHLAVTDVASGRTVLAERLRRAGSPLVRASEHDLDLALEDWTLARAADDALSLSAHDPATGIGIAFRLTPEKPLVLHGERGYSKKGGAPESASAYSSWTRLRAEGELTAGGETRAVTGAAWYDHEFSTALLEDDVEGWDWFGLQLDDGRDLMLFTLRKADGTRAAAAGTLVARDGSATALDGDAFTIAPTARWTSPKTGATYPARWTITVPGAGLSLDVRPLVEGAELDTARTTGVTYWEGPVALEGSARGRGYAELTGYAGTMGGKL